MNTKIINYLALIFSFIGAIAEFILLIGAMKKDSIFWISFHYVIISICWLIFVISIKVIFENRKVDIEPDINNIPKCPPRPILSKELNIKILSDEIIKIKKRLSEINRDIYFLLYDMLNEWHIKYNPCQFEGNKCIKNQKDNSINGCCPHCPNNTLVGCKIKSIGCKLFLCQEAFNNLSDEAKEEFRKIEYLIDDLGVNKELRKTFE